MVWFKEITLVLIQRQGTGPGAVRMLVLGEGATDAVLTVPCSSQAHLSASWAFPGSHPKHFTNISGTQNASQVSSFVIFEVEDFFLLHSDKISTANLPAASQLIFPVPVGPKNCALKVSWLWVRDPAPCPSFSVVLLGDLVQAVQSCCTSDTYVPQG